MAVPSSRRGQISRKNRAQSLVEFALVAPLLTLMLLGAIDLTRAFYSYIVLANATREAARVLIDYPSQYSDTAACQAATREASSYITLSCTSSPATVTISPAANTSVTPPTRTPGRKAVTVTATTTFTPVTVLIQLFTGGSLTIKAQTTMLTWY